MKKYLIIIVTLFFFSCDTYDNYFENHGNPRYKVTLYNSYGDVLDVKYAHEKYESFDWGLHKNYEFRYWRWKYYGNSVKFGRSYLETWEWDKDRIKIERR